MSAGRRRLTEGTVEIAGHDITTMSDTELTKLRRTHIGFVFQFFNLLPMLTAEENITLPLRIAGTKVDAAWFDVWSARSVSQTASPSPGGAWRPAAARRDRRALLSKPSVLFADEPTGNLDSTTSAEILEVLRAAVEDYGQTTIMVTHDAKAAAIADRILFLADGQVVRELGPSTRPRSSTRSVRSRRSDLGRTQGTARPQAARRSDGFSVVLGVAMVSGSFVLTDSIQQAFHTLFSSSYSNTDAVVTGKKLVDYSSSGNATMPASLLTTVRAQPDVAAPKA